MIVPQYWAEARLRQRVRRRQVTITRYGWSDVSQEDAQEQADRRANEAMARMVAGEKLARREPKVAYNGAEGVPIREEILSRHGETIITRNLYGAHCLNTPNVFFIDIDNDIDTDSCGLQCLVIVILLIASVVVGAVLATPLQGILFAVVGIPLSLWILSYVQRMLRSGPDQRENKARKRIERFLESRPDWSVRLYRTPHGLRVLVMHRTFDPLEPEVEECFQALDADYMYRKMCRNQRCFRARVSPKPWRIGIDKHIRPRPGVWPLDPKWATLRQEWIRRYDQLAPGFAACHFVEELGSAKRDPIAAGVQRLHDELCRAHTSLPLA